MNKLFTKFKEWYNEEIPITKGLFALLIINLIFSISNSLGDIIVG